MKQKNKLLCAFAVSLFLVASLASIASALGNDPQADEKGILGNENDIKIDFEAEGYIPVSSPTDLAKVGTEITSLSEFDGKEYDWLLSDKYYLTENIYLKGVNNHIPIGPEYLLPFKGVFDGNGHKISGMNVVVNGDASDSAYGGLFGFAQGAQICNLSVEDSSVTVTNMFPYSSVTAGGIVAHGIDITISGCFYSGSVTASAGWNAYAGGIIGSISFLVHAKELATNCHNNGTVSASSDGDRDYPGIAHAGGIIGQIYSSEGSTEVATNGYNNGAVNASSKYGNTAAGGIVGQIYSPDDSLHTTTNSHNNGTVSASSESGSASAGGIFGNGFLTGTSCHNNGTVNASSESCDAAAGGIFGIGPPSETNCHNNGTVSASSEYSNATAGGIGGIIANPYYMTWTATDAYNNGKITATGTSVAIGGIFGSVNHFSMMSEPFSIKNSHNTGMLEGYSAGDIYVGGIIGQFNGSDGLEITDCYNAAAVTATSIKTGSSSGSAVTSAAGILGGMHDYQTAASVSGCYNTGKITVTNETTYAYAGGLTGDGRATMTKCYNEGNITVTATAASSNVYAGGIASQSGREITNCYNTGNVTVTATAASSNAYAGGISYMSAQEATNCYNTGNVTATATVESSYAYAGGLAYRIAGVIVNCYNTGNVTATAITEAHAAGIISQMNFGVVVNCYSVGIITATAENAHAAGVIGGWWIEIGSCYFLKGTVIENGIEKDTLAYGFEEVLVDGNAGGTPRKGIQGSGAKSAEELKASLIDILNGDSIYYQDGTEVWYMYFEGWDFENTWTIIEGKNNGYPVLMTLIPEGTTEEECDHTLCDVCGGCTDDICECIDCEECSCVPYECDHALCDVCGGCTDDVCECIDCEECSCTGGGEGGKEEEKEEEKGSGVISVGGFLFTPLVLGLTVAILVASLSIYLVRKT